MVSSEVVEYLEGYTVDALRARFPSSHLRTATWLIAVLFSAALAECARRAVTLGSPLNKMAPAGYQGRSPWLVKSLVGRSQNTRMYYDLERGRFGQIHGSSELPLLSGTERAKALQQQATKCQQYP